MSENTKQSLSIIASIFKNFRPSQWKPVWSEPTTVPLPPRPIRSNRMRMRKPLLRIGDRGIMLDKYLSYLVAIDPRMSKFQPVVAR